MPSNNLVWMMALLPVKFSSPQPSDIGNTDRWVYQL